MIIVKTVIRKYQIQQHLKIYENLDVTCTYIVTNNLDLAGLKFFQQYFSPMKLANLCNHVMFLDFLTSTNS